LLERVAGHELRLRRALEALEQIHTPAALAAVRTLDRDGVAAAVRADAAATLGRWR
jgi:hypothetical protein